MHLFSNYLYVHGGNSIVKDTLSALSKLPNHRLADKGEFSHRAFKNNKIKDLPQAESLSNLINAETTIQRKHATSNFQGKISRQLNIWNDQILTILAFCEADLDFGQDSGGDTQIDEDIIEERVTPLILEFLNEVEDVVKKSEVIGRRLNSGVKICITGEPNVGKSSLMNILARENVSIVTDIAGTTRDILQIPLEIGGFPVVLYDTAGIRDETEDKIEKIGIERTKSLVDEADIVIRMFSAENYESHKKIDVSVDDLVVMNKSESLEKDLEIDCVKISCLDKIGLDDLMRELVKKISACFEDVIDESAELVLTEQRQIGHLKETLRLIELFFEYKDVDRTIATEQIRLISSELGYITGRTYSIDSVLETIFSNFCVGK